MIYLLLTLAMAAAKEKDPTPRDPATDQIVLHKERTPTIHGFLRLFSDAGIPRSYRNIPGFAIHTYQVENKCGDCHFVRFHYTPDEGIKTFTVEEARRMNVVDADYLTRDLYRAIGNGDFPSWTVSLQILTKDDIKKAGPKVFDASRLLSLKEYPLHEIGKLVLTKNPRNHFADVEQLAFSPGNLVPGILGGPDKLFQSRSFAYRDTQLYRLGKNFNNIIVNCPYQTRTFTYNRDGVPPVRDNEKDIPNYYPNSFHGPVPYMTKRHSGLINIVESKADNFDQAAEYYANELENDERSRLIQNIVNSLKRVTYEPLKRKAINILKTIHLELGYRVEQGLSTTKCC
ncbi:catalase-like [Bicyclus anynana]|uniref:Catalase-like n=1 Tax=Bicyclus anynana TaxID=110368 RepID=A0ABM3LHN6_BICAN|nr:catalase-like [Bicyclus anynana]